MTQKHPCEVLWTPPNPRATAMWRFITRVNEKHGLAIDDYEALLRWSVENVAAFLEEVWILFGIKASRPYDEVSRHAPLPPPSPRSLHEALSPRTTPTIHRSSGVLLLYHHDHSHNPEYVRVG